MTVKELIEKLEGLDENMIVNIPAGWGYVPIGKVEEENNMIYLEKST